MKIVNILFNHKKYAHDNKILGVERCFIDYTKHFLSDGNDVLSVIQDAVVYKEDVEKTGSKLLQVRAFGKGDLLTLFTMTKSLLAFKPDVVICHSGRALFFARMVRLVGFVKFPIVVIDHGIKPLKFLKADYVLTVNSYFSKELVKAGKDPKTALTIPNMIEVPVDFEKPQKPAFRNPVRIGSLGRLYVEKNFDSMIRAIAILKDRGIACEYVIGGIGPIQDSLNNLAKKLKVEDSFKILGWTSDKKSFFDSIDIFVLPSLFETFGIVLLEAMLYKTPIITSNSWGPDEVISHEVDGLKVSKDENSKTPELLADAIERLVNDQEFARSLADKAYDKFFEKYSAQKVMKQLSDIMNMIVERERKN